MFLIPLLKLFLIPALLLINLYLLKKCLYIEELSDIELRAIGITFIVEPILLTTLVMLFMTL